jgi:hypothetical protein
MILGLMVLFVLTLVAMVDIHRAFAHGQNSNRHWTPEDDRRLRGLLAQRASFSDLAIDTRAEGEEMSE